MTIKPSDLQYVILPPRFCDPVDLPLVEKAFAFWIAGWTKEYAANGTDKKPHPQDFFRQDFITMVLHDQIVVATHFYSLYDFRSAMTDQIPYVKDHFNADFIDSCRASGFLKLMSMESLLANPDYRKSKTGLNFTELMASLGQNVFREYTDADAIFAPARVDNKTSESAQRIGMRPLQRDVMVHNTPVDFLVCERNEIIPPPEPARFFMEYLWRNRRMAIPAITRRQAA